MKSLFTTLIFCFTLSSIFGQAFINELHYDNEGTDAGEGLEIAGPAGTDLSCYRVFFYNGSNGLLYDSLDLSGMMPDEGAGYGAVWFAQEGIQNGSPDAIGLVNYCTGAPFIPVHFISYEGVLVAGDGPFNGMTSEDIGVAQDNSTPMGVSLQFQGFGTVATDFLWAGPVPESKGLINPGQSFEMAVNPTVGWSGNSNQTVSEDVGSVFLELNIAAANMNDTELTISIDGGAVEGEDFQIIQQPTLFPGGSSSSLMWELEILDDSDEEMTENIEINIMSVSNNAQVIDPWVFITIEDNDSPILPTPSYDIVSVTTENIDGIADSLMVECSLTGVVTTPNFRPDGQQFYMQDATGGINVFAFSETFDYATTVGDEITVTGVIEQYNGLTEIIPTAIELISSGNDVSPIFPNELNDENEGSLVSILNLAVIDINSWPADGSSFNVPCISLDGDTVTLRIENDTELATMIPDAIVDGGVFIVTGVVGQYDTSSPYTSGYQLFPRYISDFSSPFGLHDELLERFSVSPNPVSDYINIDMDEANSELEIYSSDGRLIISKDFSSKVNVSFLESGVYFIKVHGQDRVGVQRFIKK